MRIRQGNDFIFLWTIVRSGIPEDLGNAKNIKLHFKNYDCVSEVKSFQIVDGNIVRVEVSPEWASRLGAYRLILSYEFENYSYSDGDRKCVVDVLAFNIVPKTSEADDVTEVSETTDIMIGFFGLSAYEVWLKDNPGSTKEDYYNWLRWPATDAVSLIDDKIEHLDEVIDSSTANEAERVGAENIRLSNEVGRVNAESHRVDNENERLANETSRASDELIREANESTRKQDEATRKTNENERETAETIRVSNENIRVTAEQARVEAELLRQSSTQEAILNAENATESANKTKGWSPSVAFEEYNGKQIKKLIGYIGGTGVEPTANVGQYFTENGFTNNKDLAVNFKGSSVEAMIQTRDSYNQIPEPRNPNTLYFISNQA